MTVAPNLFGVIIGRQGETKKKLEADTNTSIIVPRRGAKDQVH